MNTRWIVALGMLALLGACTDPDFSSDVFSRPTVDVEFDPRDTQCRAQETQRSFCD